MKFINVKIKKLILALLILTSSSLHLGCASGGYYLTRKYSAWVNGIHILPRILVYILTSVIYGIAMIIDLVIFNTVDFWEGKVSGGSYFFEKDGVKYNVAHEIYNESSNLRKSTILISKANQKTSKLEIIETPNHEIDLFVDGAKLAHSENIYSIPKITVFNASNNSSEEIWLFQNQIASTK